LVVVNEVEPYPGSGPGRIALGKVMTYTFTTLDNPAEPEPNQSETFLTGINNLGQISGSTNHADVGFIYSAGTYNPIVSFYSGGVGGINDQGQVVWTDINGLYGYYNGFLYSDGVNTPIGDPHAAAAYNYTIPVGINDATQIVGYYYDISDTAHGFFYDGTNYTTIDDPLGWWSAADGINNNGQIVGNYLDRTPADKSHGFLYSNGSYTTIDDPLGTNTVARGINDAGDIVGYYIDSDGIDHAFLYKGGVFTTIDDPLGTGGSVATGINDAGQMVGYYSANGGYHGFLANPNQSQPPTVSSITAATDNGEKELNASRLVTITVTTNEIVNVTGTPELQLNNNEVASYAGGTGTKALTFTYTVQQGDDISNLQVTGLVPNGATVKDGAGNSLSGPVAQDLALQINTINPIVTSASASPSSADLNAGQKVAITLTMSGPVKVKGTPTLTLNDGGTANYKAGASNPAAGILVFNYTVKSGENASNLGVTSVDTDAVGASVKDTAGDVADFANALTTFNGLQVDTTAPTVTSVVASGAAVDDNGNDDLGLGSMVTLTVNFSEATIVDTSGGVPTLNLNDGGKSIYTSGTGTNALIFSYLVAAKEDTADLAVNRLALNGGSITDGAGNKADLTGAQINPSGTLQVDSNAPVMKEHLANDTGASHLDLITSNTTLNGSADPNASIHFVVDGLPITVTATADSTGLWTFTPSGLLDGQHTIVASETDAGGNTGTASLTFTLDTVGPSVLSVTNNATNGDLGVGDGVAITLMMSEAVTAPGTLKLNLNNGGTASFDRASSDPTVGRLVFDYTPKVGQSTSDLRVASVGVLSGGAIADIAGNVANLTAANGTDLGLQIEAQHLEPATKVFADRGVNGEAIVLATLAEAAYHLVPNFELTGPGINIDYPIDDAAYNFLPAGLRLLTAGDMPSLAPTIDVSNTKFPTTGLVDGIYLDKNAAALVARSSDSLFIAFRGSNDSADTFRGLFDKILGDTPDTFDWTDMGQHWALFAPLVTAVDNFLTAHPEIKHVYVTGHSLGASMAQRFMTDDMLDSHATTSFEAVTFANPGYGYSLSSDDPRIANILIAGDPIENSPYSIRGDIYQLVNANGNTSGGSLHDLGLYYDAVQFLSSQHDAIPQPNLVTNGTRDLANIFANMTYTGNTPDPWQVAPPSGTVPPTNVFQGLPNFPTNQDDIIGVTGGGTLTGGLGNNTFTLEAGFGDVRITNFHPSTDVLQFNHALFANFAAAMANTASDGQGDTIITYDKNDSVTLLGVTTTMLQARDFHFV
jgi:probable HAF family extracellular repeat protein